MFNHSIYTQYINKIKNSIYDSTSKIKRRSVCIDSTIIKYLHRMKTDEINIEGKKYNSDEIYKELNENISEINKATRSSYYKDILMSFIKEIKHKDENEIKSILIQHENQVKVKYIDAINKIMFCMKSFSVILKLLKENKVVIEFTDFYTIEQMYNEMSKFIINERNEKYINESEELSMRETFITESNEEKDLNDFLLECAQFVIEYEDEEMMEGANLDIRKDFKQAKAEYKQNMKELKVALQGNNFDDALKSVNDVIKTLKITKLKIKNIEGNVGSFVFSLYTGFLPYLGRTLALCLLPVFGTSIAVIWNWVQSLSTTIDKIKKTGLKSLTIDDVNLYKQSCLAKLDEFIKNLNSLKGKINEQKRAYSKDSKKLKTIKESASNKEKYNTIKLALYERCADGEITIGQRERILQIAKKEYL